MTEKTRREVFILRGELARDDAHHDLLPLPLAFDNRLAFEQYVERNQPLWGEFSIGTVQFEQGVLR
jgi:hypothetical protein